MCRGFVCVVTHRCGVNKSSYKSTNVLEKCQWPPSVVTRWGDVPGAVCVATGASEGGCLVCGAASRFIPLQGGNSV